MPPKQRRMRTQQQPAEELVHFESALLIALIGFASTVALAKFALRKDVME